MLYVFVLENTRFINYNSFPIRENYSKTFLIIDTYIFYNLNAFTYIFKSNFNLCYTINT